MPKDALCKLRLAQVVERLQNKIEYLQIVLRRQKRLTFVGWHYITDASDNP